MGTRYEWVIETLDGPDTDDDVEILDVNHADTYADAVRRAGQEEHARVGLVRDRDTFDGIERAWAYVEDGRLPEWLEEAGGRQVVKVPVAYRKQFEEHR